MQGDIAAVAAHDSDEAGALVGIAGFAHAVDALAGGIEGGVETDGVVGIGKVIVDGARHADGGHAQRVERRGALVGAVAADADKALDAEDAQVLYGLLLVSGNDAATAIAGYCAGDSETFAAWMNEKAARLGMEHSRFTNPSGLNEEGHYSTAADMARLARAVLEHETLARIVSTRSVSVAGRSLTNHNKLLWQYEGCTGLKTGYTEAAGRTLVSSAERDGQTLIAVTLNDRNDWADHAALFDYGFAGYPNTMLALAGRAVSAVPVSGSLCRFAPVETVSDVYYPLTEGERVEAKIELPQAVTAPVQAGETAGQLVFTLDGEVIGETELVYSQSVSDDRAGPGLLEGLLNRLRGGA